MMNKLTKLIAPALAASLALGAAVPASAATFYNNGANVKVEIAQLDRQIDIAKARHQLSWQESASLEKQVDRLQNLYRAYSRNGLTRAEVRVLDNQIDNVKQDLARQSHDRDFGHGHGNGYGHRR
jgi:hypothetical protein